MFPSPNPLANRWLLISFLQIQWPSFSDLHSPIKSLSNRLQLYFYLLIPDPSFSLCCCNHFCFCFFTFSLIFLFFISAPHCSFFPLSVEMRTSQNPLLPPSICETCPRFTCPIFNFQNVTTLLHFGACVFSLLNGNYPLRFD